MKRHALTIETPDSFRFRTTLISHGWIQLYPFQHDEAFQVLERTHRLPDGRTIRLAFTAGIDEAIRVDVGGIDVLDKAADDAIRRAAHRVFNLDIDLSPFYEALAGEPRYSWVRTSGAGRLLRAPTVWEDLVKILLTTNTTWSMTRKMVERVTAIGPSDSGRSVFPTPEEVAALPFHVLADEVRAGYRNAYLYELATEVAEGRVDVEAWGTTEMPTGELFRRVRELKGFGPYAAGSTLKLLGRFDYLALDSAARAAFKAAFNGGQTAADKRIERHYSRYGRWKGLVIWMDVMRDWHMENHLSDADQQPPGS